MNRLTAPVFLISLIALVTACDQPLEVDSETLQPEPTDVSVYTAAQFFSTTSYGLPDPYGYAFSSDGKSILIHSDLDGVFNAYALPLDGGEPTKLTESDSNAISTVSWFPNDGRLLYSFDQGGNELDHVFVREENGAHRDLTPGDELKATFVSWNADDESFYLATTERDAQYFDLYQYDASNYSRELVYENPGFLPSGLSRNGDWLSLTKLHTSADSDIYVVDLASEDKKATLITKHTGNISYHAVSFTPNGQSLVYSTNEHGEFDQHWTYNLETGKKAPLVQADWDVMYTSFSKTGRYRASGINVDASTEVQITATKTGEAVTLPTLPVATSIICVSRKTTRGSH